MSDGGRASPAHVRFRLDLDAPYLREHLRRVTLANVKRPSALIRWFARPVGGMLLLAFVLALLLADESRRPPVSMWFGLFALAFGYFAVCWPGSLEALIFHLSMRLRRKSDEASRTTQVKLHEHGVELTTALSRSEVDWRAYASVRACADGIVLHTGPKQGLWLPDARLVEGLPEDARALVRRVRPDTIEAEPVATWSSRAETPGRTSARDARTP